MIQNSPHLFLSRLVVITNNGTIAYDEKFHKGVNIIRGQNSSGKSTIANFIFFVLGGDFNNLTMEARKCREVIAELVINNASVTLKRQISDRGLQPMSIFWNNYEESKKDIINWQTYPYKQTVNYISFSNVLFNAFSFPEVKSDSDNNITMHQILRLMYIDQDTPTQSLYRFERFDLPLTRQAIAELLLGVYDDKLYGQRLSLKNTQREIDDKKRQFDGLNKIYSQSGNITTLDEINTEINSSKSKLAEVDNAILELRKKDIVRTTKNTSLESEKNQIELIALKDQIQDAQSKINEYGIEIADSEQFISTIEKRIFDLEHSVLTRKVLGELPLTYCPQCLHPIETHVEEGKCFLCKQTLAPDAEKANATRLKLEMELQIKESKSLLESKNKKKVELSSLLLPKIEKARFLQKQLDTSIKVSQSTRDARIDSLLIEKGGIENKIEFLSQQIKAVEMLDLLKSELAKLSSYVESLRLEISQKEQIHKRNLDTAHQKIKEHTLYILNNDLDRQNEFRTGKQVEVDFYKDTYSLDGDNNFSASSKIYFKNAVLFSIFFSSLNLTYFRYPRFILCDNMEDKGMEKERSQNLQKLITVLSEKSDVEHQIIFTTSMIATELNNTAYCIGDEYNRDNKTLKV